MILPPGSARGSGGHAIAGILTVRTVQKNAVGTGLPFRVFPLLTGAQIRHEISNVSLSVADNVAGPACSETACALKFAICTSPLTGSREILPMGRRLPISRPYPSHRKTVPTIFALLPI